MWSPKQIIQWAWEQTLSGEAMSMDHLMGVCAAQIGKEKEDHWAFMLGMMYPWQRFVAGEKPLYHAEMAKGNWREAGKKVLSFLATNVPLLPSPTPEEGAVDGYLPLPPHDLTSLVPSMPWDITGTAMDPDDPLTVRALQTSFEQHYGEQFGEWAVRQAVLVYIAGGAEWTKQGATQTELYPLTLGRLRDLLGAHVNDIIRRRAYIITIEGKLRTAKGTHAMKHLAEIERLEALPGLVSWLDVKEAMELPLVEDKERAIREIIGDTGEPKAASLSKMLYGNAVALPGGRYLVSVPGDSEEQRTLAKQLGIRDEDKKAPPDPVLVSLGLAMVSWQQKNPQGALDNCLSVIERMSDALTAAEIERIQRIIG